MPFMEQPPGSHLSAASVLTYGRAVRALRRFNRDSLNVEPAWRKPGPELKTGYKP
jgi:hydrogenase small subunit